MTVFSFELINPEAFDHHQWNNLIAGLPYVHVMQTAEWGQIKSQFGWQCLPVVWKDSNGNIRAAAMLLSRSITVPILSRILSFLYVPKGPLLDWSDSALRLQVLRDLEMIARNRRAIFIKIDPDVQSGTGQPMLLGSLGDKTGYEVVSDLEALGWRYSHEQVQFKNTVQIDLSLDQDQLLARMKPKTRYNLRLAGRKGVKIRKGDVHDIPILYRLFLETSVRDNFVIREQAYYQELWLKFLGSDLADVFIAEVNGKAIAGVILFRFAGKAWFFFGMSGSEDREKMPNYLLQWELILSLKDKGCRIYDLWGAPDEFNETDPLWGVYRFKEGLGGVTVRHIGAWDLPLSNSKFYLYSKILPALVDWMRWRGKSRARRQLA